MSKTEPVRFSNSTARYLTIGFGLFIALLGVGQFTRDPPAPGSGIFYIVLGLVFALGSMRTASIEVTDSDVRCRYILHTKVLPFEELLRAEGAIGRTGLNGFNREHVLFTYMDGGTYRFNEMNFPTRPAP